MNLLGLTHRHINFNLSLIVHGKKDILVPSRNGELLAEKMPTAEVVYFKENAHLIHTEEPDKFLDVLFGFLK